MYEDVVKAEQYNEGFQACLRQIRASLDVWLLTGHPGGIDIEIYEQIKMLMDKNRYD